MVTPISQSEPISSSTSANGDSSASNLPTSDYPVPVLGSRRRKAAVPIVLRGGDDRLEELESETSLLEGAQLSSGAECCGGGWEGPPGSAHQDSGDTSAGGPRRRLAGEELVVQAHLDMCVRVRVHALSLSLSALVSGLLPDVGAELGLTAASRRGDREQHLVVAFTVADPSVPPPATQTSRAL
ncbi:unnamed protein product [Schistocephalus solidus]|uniref:Uncharacterized protein n=1 Tax=Schistocephalus solidus TaxID=70667 RepID=A0A183SMV6_SCHSO|nr:unnamed protein product [Schistocephalus solidus]